MKCTYTGEQVQACQILSIHLQAMKADRTQFESKQIFLWTEICFHAHKLEIWFFSLVYVAENKCYFINAIMNISKKAYVFSYTMAQKLRENKNSKA